MSILLQSLSGLRAAFEVAVDRVVAQLPALTLGIVVFVAFYLGAKVARGGATTALTRIARDPRAGSAWGVIVHYVVLLVGIVAALATAGVDLAALMVAVGALAFGLAFAMQDTVANLISGLIILTSHPFSTGDAVEAAGQKGVVEEIGIRSTKLRSFDGLHVEVPNREVLGAPITVYTYHRTRRFDIGVGISYDDDITGAVETALTAVRSVPEVLDDPAPEVLVDELGGSSVNLIVRFWMDRTTGVSLLVTKAEVIRRVKEALDEVGYDIPYPIRTLYLHGAGGSGGTDDPGTMDGPASRAPGRSSGGAVGKG